MKSPPDAYYRADIDGLRAFAVIAVILYHLNEQLLPGGFMGVDIFFAISGFVVTASVVRAESLNPVGDVLRFWRRRLLRILPALIVFVLGTTILTALFMPAYPAVDYDGSVRTGIAALFGASNLYLARLGQNYFAADEGLSLFSHTWSLGIEEQFYVLFSILVIALPAILFNQRVRRLGQVAILVAMTATSFTLFVAGAAREPLETYYFVHTRFWELGFGGLLALTVARRGAEKTRSPVVFELVALASLGVLLWSVTAKAGLGSFPTWRIVLAVTAPGALVLVGEIGHTVVARMLMTRAIVFIGLMSYSLYLWHWPILRVFDVAFGLRNGMASLLALAAITAAGFASYRLVEVRYRWSSRPFLRHLLPRLAAGFAIALLVSGLTMTNPGSARLGSSQRWLEDWLQSPTFDYAGGGRLTQRECVLHAGEPVPQSIPEACYSDPQAANVSAPTVFAIGDSFSAANWAMVGASAKSGAARVVALAHSDCSASVPAMQRPPSCRLYWDFVVAAIPLILERNDVVFVSFFWHFDPTGEETSARSQLTGIVEAARKVGAKVMVQAPLPVFGRAGYMCIPDWYRASTDGCTRGRAEVERDRAGALAALRATEGVTTWDPVPLLCNDRCGTFDRETPAFRDRIHISHSVSTQLAPEFVRAIERARSVPAA